MVRKERTMCEACGHLMVGGTRRPAEAESLGRHMCPLPLCAAFFFQGHLVA